MDGSISEEERRGEIIGSTFGAPFREYRKIEGAGGICQAAPNGFPVRKIRATVLSR
jgi:hypothetical protein